jgi:hypothetical protein
MADPSPQRYERLPGTGYRQIVPVWAMVLLFFVIGIFVLLLRGRRVQLWRGEDHLLIVDWDGYREYYKRINYRDIQSVVVHRTADAFVANLVLGAVMLVFVGLGLVVDDNVGMIILLVIAGVFGLILLANLLQGPTCKCQLRTAVQAEELHSLGRLPNARKALDVLRPLITAAQGTLTAEEIPQRLQEAALAASSTTDAIGFGQRPLASGAPVPPRPYRSQIHFIFFCILLTDLPFTLVGVWSESSVTNTVSVIWLLTAWVFAIVALVKQGGTNLPGLLKSLPGVFLAASVVQIVGGIAYSIAGASESATSMEDPVSLAITVVSTTLSVGLGLMGLLKLRQFRAGQRAVQAPPIPSEPTPG